jgi:predicted DCC family thiol-disulfide oxidoreductase YuxK
VASSNVKAQSAETLAELAHGPVLLFDGECGVCAASVQWVLAHERKAHEQSGTLRFAALESPAGRGFLAASGLNKDVDSLVWLEAEGGHLRADYYADAVRRALRYVGGPWTILLALLALVPRPVRDLGYRTFARHRQAVAARQCLVPTPTQKARFFEQLAKPAGH